MTTITLSAAALALIGSALLALLILAARTLSVMGRLEKRLISLEIEATKERPLVVMPAQGGRPQVVYPESGRVETPPIVDKGEEERRRLREFRKGRRSRDPLEEDRDPIIVE